MLVEFALVAPLLFALLLGIVTGGIALNRKLSLEHATREAARYGATIPQDQCDDTSNCGGQTWAAYVRNQAVERAAGDLGASDVCVALVSGPGNDPAAVTANHVVNATSGTRCFVDNHSGSPSDLRVQVYTRRTGDRLEFLFGSRDLTLTAQGVARFER